MNPKTVISSVIMCHPHRIDAARVLRDQHPELGFSIVVDPDPAGPPDASRTARLAWRAVADDATHHLLVQDDMALAPGFAQHLAEAVRAFPDRILCFFTEWGSRTSHALRLATLEGASWVPVLDPYIPTTAVLVPASVARELADYPCDSTDDVLLLRYAAQRGHVPLVSVPNLAEHTSPISLMGNDVLMGERRSALFASSPLNSVVSRQTIVPHLLMFEGLSICHVRSGTGWDTIKTHELLMRQYALSLPNLLQQFAKAVPDQQIIGVPLLFQLWLTAFAYGAFTDDLANLDSPLCREAMSTFLPGAVRRFVPSCAPVDLLQPFIIDAIRMGNNS